MKITIARPTPISPSASPSMRTRLGQCGLLGSGALWRECDDLHADQRVGIQHRRAHEGHGRHDIVEHAVLESVEERTWLDVDHWMHPYGCVNDVAQLGAEVPQTTKQMIAHCVELRRECGSEDGLAFVEPHNSCDGREHEIAGAYAECCTVRTTVGIVALNPACAHKVAPRSPGNLGTLESRSPCVFGIVPRSAGACS